MWWNVFSEAKATFSRMKWLVFFQQTIWVLVCSVFQMLMHMFHLSASQSIQQTHTAVMFMAFKNRFLWKSSHVRCFSFFFFFYSKWHISMTLWLPGAVEKESNLMTYWPFLHCFLCYTFTSAWVVPPRRQLERIWRQNHCQLQHGRWAESSPVSLSECLSRISVVFLHAIWSGSTWLAGSFWKTCLHF